MSPQVKHMYSVRGAAEQLSVSRSTVYVLMNEGKLRSVKVGGRRLITSDAIAEFIERAEFDDEPNNGNNLPSESSTTTSGRHTSDQGAA